MLGRSAGGTFNARASLPALYLRDGPPSDVMGMAALAVKTSYPLLSSPELEQVRRFMKVARTPVVEIKSASMNLSLRRHSPDARLHERQCLD